MGSGDGAKHHGETRTFSAAAGRDFTGDTAETVGRMRHRTFVASCVARDADVGDGVNYRVVPGAREQRGEPFLLAQLGKDSCAVLRFDSRFAAFRCRRSATTATATASAKGRRAALFN